MPEHSKWLITITSRLVDFAPITLEIMAPTAKDAQRLVECALLTARVNATPALAVVETAVAPRLQLRARV